MNTIEELEFLINSEIEEVAFIQDYLELRTEYGVIRLFSLLSLLKKNAKINDGDINFEHEIRKLLNTRIKNIKYEKSLKVEIEFGDEVCIISVCNGYEMMNFVKCDTFEVLVWD